MVIAGIACDVLVGVLALGAEDWLPQAAITTVAIAEKTRIINGTKPLRRADALQPPNFFPPTRSERVFPLLAIAMENTPFCTVCTKLRETTRAGSRVKMFMGRSHCSSQ